MNVVAIIQARMGSTRLPGKVLMDLAGEPMLARVVERTRRASSLASVVVATTTEARDYGIDQLCMERDWDCFLGSEWDVLDRYYRAATAYRADCVVRITSDCPLIDPETIDRVVREFLRRQPSVEYVTNFVPRRTYPRGLEVQAIRFDTLERVWRQETVKAGREHVTYHIDLHTELFDVFQIANSVDYSSMRWTVDTEEDLRFVSKIYEHFGHDRFSWRDVLTALEKHPEWTAINEGVTTEDLLPEANSSPAGDPAPNPDPVPD